MEPLADAPTNLVASLEVQDVVLSWDAVEGAAGYALNYGTISGGPYSSTFSQANEGASPISTTETTLRLTGLAQDNTFYFVVTALDDEGVESYPSNEVSATIPLADEYESDDTRIPPTQLFRENHRNTRYT